MELESRAKALYDSMSVAPPDDEENIALIVTALAEIASLERAACLKIAEEADVERQFVENIMEAIRSRGL